MDFNNLQKEDPSSHSCLCVFLHRRKKILQSCNFSLCRITTDKVSHGGCTIGYITIKKCLPEILWLTDLSDVHMNPGFRIRDRRYSITHVYPFFLASISNNCSRITRSQKRSNLFFLVLCISTLSFWRAFNFNGAVQGGHQTDFIITGSIRDLITLVHDLSLPTDNIHETFSPHKLCFLLSEMNSILLARLLPH